MKVTEKDGRINQKKIENNIYNFVANLMLELFIYYKGKIHMEDIPQRAI